MKDLEKVYDEKISPLMGQILDICREHDMPMFAEFQYSEDGFCKSYINTGHPVMLHHDVISQCKGDNGINIDKYMMWVASQAKNAGHSSIVLKQMGIPVTPNTND